MVSGSDELFSEHRISSGDGLILYMRDYGEQHENVVLCLGGLTRNSKDFHQLAIRLSSHYRIIAPDYRGRGQSAYDPDWRHYEPRTYLDDIRHITTVLGVHRFATIGTSLGGILAMALGTAMPGAISGALLNDIGPEVSTTGLDPILSYMRTTAPLPHWDAAIAVLQKFFPHLPARTPEDWQRIAEASYRDNGSGQLVFNWDQAIIRGVENQDISSINLWPYFHSLRRVPVMAVRGALSSFVTDDLWLEMRTERPDIIQVTVDDVGHAPSLDEPVVVSSMEQWLARIFLSRSDKRE